VVIIPATLITRKRYNVNKAKTHYTEN